MRASRAGSLTETRTSICAARWNTTSGARRSISSATDGSQMSIWWNENSWSLVERASDRFASLPVERLSTTSTEWPSARSRSTRLEPMNPAPPVTSALIGNSPYQVSGSGKHPPLATVPAAMSWS